MKKQVLLTIMLILAVFLIPMRGAAMNDEAAADTCGCTGADGVGSFKMLSTLRASGTAMEVTKVSFTIPMEFIEYPGGVVPFAKSPYYEGAELKYPVEIDIDRVNTGTVKVKYSLYTFKQKFLKDSGTYRLYELGGCGTDNFPAQTTQADIDNNLDKIYEFPDVTETASGRTILYWDGKTDTKITGQKESMPVRACVYFAAHNADTGELIAIGVSGGALQNYQRGFTYPELTVNKDKDGKETLSMKIFYAYDDRPVKITLMLLTTGCGVGLAAYDMVNKGAEGMIAAINSSSGEGFHDVAAYTEVINPTIDPENPQFKRYEWNDIVKINWNDSKWKDFLKNAQGNAGNGTGGWPWKPIAELNGNYFAPVQDQYLLGYIIEALDDKGNPIETYTGINEGFVVTTGYFDVPPMDNPKSMTAIPGVKTNDGIKIGTTDDGNINLLCDKDVCTENSYSIVDMTGRTVQTGVLSGASEQTITVSPLPLGVYFIVVNSTEGGKYTWKVVINK